MGKEVASELHDVDAAHQTSWARREGNPDTKNDVDVTATGKKGDGRGMIASEKGVEVEPNRKEGR